MSTLQKNPGDLKRFLIMALSNELSSEIAVAILIEKKNPQELKQLKEVILQVHGTLQQMSEAARLRRVETKLSSKSQMPRHMC